MAPLRPPRRRKFARQGAPEVMRRRVAVVAQQMRQQVVGLLKAAPALEQRPGEIRPRPGEAGAPVQDMAVARLRLVPKRPPFVGGRGRAACAAAKPRKNQASVPSGARSAKGRSRASASAGLPATISASPRGSAEGPKERH